MYFVSVYNIIQIIQTKNIINYKLISVIQTKEIKSIILYLSLFIKFMIIIEIIIVKRDNGVLALW